MKSMSRNEKIRYILFAFGEMNDANQEILLSRAVLMANEKAANTPDAQSEVLISNQ